MKKVNRIGALMIISQLLLTAFILQWLISQYKEERSGLAYNIHRQFIDSQDQAVDSMIELNLIDPLMKERTGFKVHLEIEDSVPDQIMHKRNNPDSLLVRKRTLHDEDKIVTIEHRGDTSESDLLMHGVKLFIRKATTKGGKDIVNKTVFHDGDTIMFRKIAEHNIKKEDARLKVRWITNYKEDSLSRSATEFYFRSHLFPKAFAAEVTGYNAYLFQKITPQILFAILLSGLTIISFLFSYRALRRQVQLNVLKNDFISNISHELKTPVSTVKVALEALQQFDRKAEPQKTEEYLEIAAKETDRLQMLINKVLNISALV